MANPTGDFFIQTTRMQINDNVDYFQSSKERAIDLFRIAQSRLEHPAIPHVRHQVDGIPADGRRRRGCRVAAGRHRAGGHQGQPGPTRALAERASDCVLCCTRTGYTSSRSNHSSTT